MPQTGPPERASDIAEDLKLSGRGHTTSSVKQRHQAATGKLKNRMIGIGAAVARRPLPHHRAYGSAHGGSSGYTSSPRPMTEDRAI